ncbi:MAG: ribonuclease E/G [Chitinophagales bacterium]|jgi:ribonuclease G|nr:ribonuclease E/G [Chitinophagales bacterium]
MSKQLLISKQQDLVKIAFVDDGVLSLYNEEDLSDKFHCQDIIIGNIVKFLPSMNSAFVDIGSDRYGFLNFSDLSSYQTAQNRYLNQRLNGNTALLETMDIANEQDIFKIQDFFSIHQRILVQITKEQIDSKGHKLSTQLSIAGRTMVLLPFGHGVNISKKIIDKDERNRLKEIFTKILPHNFGIIIRTNAENLDADIIISELTSLVNKWKSIHEKIPKSGVSEILYREQDAQFSVLRDMLNNSFDEIIVDSSSLYDSINEYLKEIKFQKKNILKNHNGKNAIDLFEKYQVNHQLKKYFNRIIPLKTGGYLIVEKTEAMFVIDVNLGKNSTKSAENKDIWQHRTNMEATYMIAKILKLRNIGGIIIIDYIDVKDQNYRNELYQTMTELLKEDRAQTTVLPLSPFCLMQITRSKKKTPIEISNNLHNKIPESWHLIEQFLEMAISTQNHHKKLIIQVNPMLKAYLKAGFPSLRLKWMLRYKKYIVFSVNQLLDVHQFKLFDANSFALGS